MKPESPALAPGSAIRAVADAVLRDSPQPIAFDWGEGVLLAGMARAYRVTGDERYAAWLRQFAAHWSEKGVTQLLTNKGYCGHWAPALAMLEIGHASNDPRCERLALQVLDYIEHGARRTRNGGLSHFRATPQLWLDTLAMACPLLSQASAVLHRPDLQRAALQQFDIYAAHLRDTDSGLFYHMWDETTDRRTTNFWARGNGWVAMSLADCLRGHEPEAGSSRAVAMFRSQAAAIAALQDGPTGLWHTVLDAPETYLETSASAMFLYALARGSRSGILDPSYAGTMRRAWAGLTAQLDGNARVTGVSAGTMPWPKARYAAVPRGTYSWGTGAFLLAAGEYAEVIKGTSHGDRTPKE